MAKDKKAIGLGAALIAILALLFLWKRGKAKVGRRPPCGDAGDVDGDGWVTNDDAQMIAEYVVGNITLTPAQLARADVNGDGIVDVVDAMFIAQYVEGVRDTLPICQTANIITIIGLRR